MKDLLDPWLRPLSLDHLGVCGRLRQARLITLFAPLGPRAVRLLLCRTLAGSGALHLPIGETQIGVRQEGVLKFPWSFPVNSRGVPWGNLQDNSQGHLVEISTGSFPERILHISWGAFPERILHISSLRFPGSSAAWRPSGKPSPNQPHWRGWRPSHRTAWLGCELGRFEQERHIESAVGL